MAEAFQADRDRDVIVQHVRETGDDSANRDRWIIYLGTTKRGESEDQSRALVFARLLADVVKRPIWVLHGTGEFRRPDAGSIRGCSCC
jgi:hypothetical protein